MQDDEHIEDLPELRVTKKDRRRLQKNTPVESDTSFDGLLRKFNIKDWDYVIIGDGSGQSWDIECGWAALVVAKTGEVDCVYGAMSSGTVNIGEIMPYIQALNRIDAWEIAKQNKRRKQRTACKVYLITDSEYVVRRALDGNSEGTHGALWAAINHFRYVGFLLHWHWIPRDTFQVNRYVDDISRKARLCLNQLRKQLTNKKATDR